MGEERGGVFEAIRDAWRRNWGIVKMGDVLVRSLCKTPLWALPDSPCSSQPFLSLGAVMVRDRGGESLAFAVPPSAEDPFKVLKFWWS